jgi:hypothetical protein
MRKSNKCAYSVLGRDRIRSEEAANIECEHPKKFLHVSFSQAYRSYIEHNNFSESVMSKKFSLRVGKSID